MKSSILSPHRVVRLFLLLTTVLVVPVFLAPVYAGVPSGTTLLLNADFDAHIAGEALEAGGALLGEPVDLSFLDGTIVENVPGDNFLQVNNNSGSSDAFSLVWQPVNNQEITTGNVVIKFSFTPSELDAYNFGVRESGSSARNFLHVIFTSNGTFNAWDDSGAVVLINNTYVAKDELDVVIEFDMDAGTSQMTVNGLTIFSAQEHKIIDRGVGRLFTGYSNGNAATPFDLDDVSIEVEGPLPLVLDADLQDQPLGQPIGTGGAELNQPVHISAGMVNEVIDRGLGNRALRMENPEMTPSHGVRWEFLDNLEVDTGLVAFDVDLLFESLDGYYVLIRESGSAASSFLNLRFMPSGLISIEDWNGVAPIAETRYEADQLYRLRLIYDLDAETYSVFLDDTAVLVDRAHGVVTGRGVGSIHMGFFSGASTNAAMIIDDLQVGVADAPILPGELEFQVEPTAGIATQLFTPKLEVKVITVFDQSVADGMIVEVGIESGPAGAVLSGNFAATVEGVAKFNSLKVNLPGTYRLRARSARATKSSLVDVIIADPPEETFRDGFE